MTMHIVTRNREPLPSDVEAEIRRRIAATHWRALVTAAPDEHDAEADAEFAQWGTGTARIEYARAIQSWLLLECALPAIVSAIGASSSGGHFLDPGAARRLSDAALTGTGWRLYAAVVIGPVASWTGAQLIMAYVEPVT